VLDDEQGGQDARPVRVAVIAAYPTVRVGLRALLEPYSDVEVVGEAASPVFLADGPAVDVVVVDLEEGTGDAATVMNLPAVVLGDSPEQFAEIPLAPGSPGAYLLKGAGAAEIHAAVIAVAEGLVVLDPAVRLDQSSGSPASNVDDFAYERLTERESEVLALLALGLPNKAIALRLGISDHTVKFHVSTIFSKLGASSRTEAVMVAARRGLLPL
jgi:DNA-binding NarL/FixJ family response regulator